jgi:hypothetical protein
MSHNKSEKKQDNLENILKTTPTGGFPKIYISKTITSKISGIDINIVSIKDLYNSKKKNNDSTFFSLE